MNTTLTDAEQALDEVHGKNWDVYRHVGNGGWTVTVKDGPLTSGLTKRSKTTQGANLTEAILAACDIRFPPLVPRKPAIVGCQVERGDKNWLTVRYVGGHRDGHWTYKTKKEASAQALFFEDFTRKKFNEWHAAGWGQIIASGVEGVDWEWER